MFEFFTNLWQDLRFWGEGLVRDFFEFLSDIPIFIVAGILDAFASVIETIEPPEFIENNGLNTAINDIHPDILYFLSVSSFAESMAILSLGFAFRMGRKLITLFQW